MSKEETMEKLSEWEMINQKLKLELKDAAQLLIAKSNELVNSKAELQRHRQEIDVSVQLMSLWNLLHRIFFSLSHVRDLIKTFVI